MSRRSATQLGQLCRRWMRGNFEAIRHGVLARALIRRHGPAACDGAQESIDAAAALIERTGARLLVPVLCEWCAELAGVGGGALLREARQGYAVIGAPRQAARLEDELAS